MMAHNNCSKDPLICAEIKRLQNRIKSRKILGKDLLRLNQPPLNDDHQRKLWHELQALKTTYDNTKKDTAFEEQYELHEEIGQGGMSLVFKAIRLKDGIPVAIKYLRDEFFNSPDIVKRFQNECEIATKFNHPNIIDVFDHGAVDQKGYLVMEYLPLGGMDQKLGTDAFGPLLALEAIRQIACALAYMHDQKVIHRDVKLSNMLISKYVADDSIDLKERIHVKLTDFGLSKKLPNKGLTKVGAKLGTDFYIAPEQVISPSTVDHRADIYSLAVALYRLISGDAFPVGNFSPMTDFYSQLPKEIDDLLLECLYTNPLKRYSSAENLALELEKCINLII